MTWISTGKKVSNIECTYMLHSDEIRAVERNVANVLESADHPAMINTRL